jgi:protein-tyrosine phosphatase
MVGRVEDGSGAVRVVLFVCTGNICRSPMAEVVLRSLCAGATGADGRPLEASVRVESAGTSDWHAGSQMDPRARAALDAAGFGAPGTPAQQVTDEQLADADLVVALDQGHRAELRRRRPDVEATVLRWWSEGLDLDVFDPYFGDDGDHARCLELIEPACAALVRALADGTV